MYDVVDGRALHRVEVSAGAVLLTGMRSYNLLGFLVCGTEELPLGRHHLWTSIGRALRTEVGNKKVQLQDYLPASSSSSSSIVNRS